MEKYETWLTEGKAVTERLLIDLKLASASWAHFEAINCETEESRADFRRALNEPDHSGTIDGLMSLFLRDTLMALFRMSDPCDNKRHTFLKVSGLLHENQFTEQRLESIPIANELFLEYEVRILRDKISKFKDCVPAKKWGNGESLPNLKLHNYRIELLPLRNSLLAHAGDFLGNKDAQINKTRDWLKLSNELVSTCHHIFMGSPISNMLETYLPKQNLFWDHAARGFVATASQASMIPDHLERITVNPEICGGRPCIRGMRIRVSDILDMLAEGATRADIQSSYAYLEDEDIFAAVTFAARNAA
jgi:uncharacterized protein (DUF433 family)